MLRLAAAGCWLLLLVRPHATQLAGLPYQLPTPTGEGPSPWKGGLPNVAVTMQKGGCASPHSHSRSHAHSRHPSRTIPLAHATYLDHYLSAAMLGSWCRLAF